MANLTVDVALVPTTPIEEPSKEWDSDYIDFRDLRSQGWYSSDTARRTWALRYRVFSDADYQLIKAFWNGVRGSYEKVGWTHPKTGESLTVRLVKGSLSTIWEAGSPVAVTFRIVETT